MRPVPPALGLAVGVLAVSWGAPLARLTDAAPLAVAMWRMVLATVLLAPVAGLPRSWPRLRERKGSIALAGICLGLHFGLWIPSLWLTTVSASVILVTTQPLWVLLVSPALLGTAIRRVNVISFSLALVGVAVISWGDFALSGRALLGDAMALGGAMSGAAYLVIGKRIRTEVPLRGYLAVVYGCAAAVLVAAVAFTGTDPMPRVAIAWLPLLGLALGPTLTGHTLLNWSLLHMEAYRVNLAVLLEPVLAIVWAWLVLQELPPVYVIPGGLLVLAAVGLEVALAARGGRGEAAIRPALC